MAVFDAESAAGSLVFDVVRAVIGEEVSLKMLMR